MFSLAFRRILKGFCDLTFEIDDYLVHTLNILAVDKSPAQLHALDKYYLLTTALFWLSDGHSTFEPGYRKIIEVLGVTEPSRKNLEALLEQAKRELPTGAW